MKIPAESKLLRIFSGEQDKRPGRHVMRPLSITWTVAPEKSSAILIQVKLPQNTKTD